MERHGFDRPTDTMWLLDDFIRDEINKARSLLDADKDDEFIAMQQTIVDDLRDLMAKEETISITDTSYVFLRALCLTSIHKGL